MTLDGTFHTKIVGVTFKNDDGSDRQRIIRTLSRNGELEAGAELFFMPQPTNPYDSNCILVQAGNGLTLGSLSRDIAAKVAPQIRQGYKFKAFVSSQTGGDIGYAYGINIKVERYKPETGYSENKSQPYRSEARSPQKDCQNQEITISSNPQVQQLYRDAMAGDMVAQHNMGGCYMEGVGVEKDPIKAVYWFKKAAEQGSLSAMDNMGLFYLNGIGVEQNDDEALSWFVLAANSGYADAQNNMGCCYMSGVGVHFDPQSAIKWWRLAADQKHPAALFNLGLAYLDGNGVEKNVGKALQYIVDSSKEGHQPAVDFLNSL